MTRTLKNGSWASFTKQFIALYLVEMLIASAFVGVFVFSGDEAAAGGRGDDIIVDINGNGDYTGIQDAIDGSKDGDTIRVWAGTYQETINVTRTLTIIGNGSEETAIDGDGRDNVVKITADWTNVSGFRIEDSKGGRLAALWVEANRTRISENNCSKNAGYGIYLNSVRYNIIENNTFKDNYGWDIYLYDSHHNTMANNTLFYQRDGSGILSQWSSYNTFRNNAMWSVGLLFDSEFRDSPLEYWNTHDIDTSNTVNGKPLYYYRNQTSGTVPAGAGQVILANCSNMVVEDQDCGPTIASILAGYSSQLDINNNSCNGKRYGIFLFNSDNCSIADNDCQYNIMFGIVILKSVHNTVTNNICLYNGQGIKLEGECEHNVITNNNCSFNNNVGIYLAGYYLDNHYNYIANNSCYKNTGLGIYIRGQGSSPTLGCTVVNNTCTGNGYSGIGLKYTSNSVLTDNVLSGNEFGIHLEGVSRDNVAHNNTITGNSLYGINATENGGNYINATNNWWGDASGPYHAVNNTDGKGDNVTDFVYFDTWLEGLKGVLYVDDDAPDGGDGSKKKPFNTIQEAVDSAGKGDTIYVWAGTYSENVVVDKTLNLMGNNSASTVIDGGENGDVMRITADSCEVTGFRVTGSEDSDGNSGIEVVSDHNTIRDCRFNNDYWGVALIGADYNTIANINCSDCNSAVLLRSANHNTLENSNCSNTRHGITVVDTSDDNTFANNTSSHNDLYGINFHEADSNLVVNNTFEHNQGYSLRIAASHDNTVRDNVLNNNNYGLTIRDSNNNVITNSTIRNNKVGIYTDGPALNNAIRNSTISGNREHGIDAANNDDNYINATNNWWGDASGPYHAVNNTEGTGDNVTDNVLFDPWLVKLGDFPVRNMDKEKDYATISEAVEDADAGDTIRIDEANFTEEVDISKELTFTGNGGLVNLSGNITIESGGVLTLDDLVLFFDCKSEDGEHGIFNNAGELYITDSEINATTKDKGFKMVLSSKSRLTDSSIRNMWQRNEGAWWLARGIEVWEDDVVISGCDIGWDYRDPGNKVGTAVYVDHASPTILDSSFENCERIGIIMDYSEDVEIYNCTFRNSFQGVYAHRESSYRARECHFDNLSADALTTETNARDTWLENTTFVDCYTRRNYQLLSGKVQLFNTTIQGTIIGEFPDIKVGNGADVKSLNANFNLSYIEMGDTNSKLLLRNYLSVHVNDSKGLDLEDADLKVEVDGAPVYATGGYGGSDEKTDGKGNVLGIIATDRSYENSNEAVMANTSIFVKYDDKELALYGVNMSKSHTEWFSYGSNKAPEVPTIPALLKFIPVDEAPSGMIVTRDSKTLYVGTYYGKNIAVIDTETDEVIETIDLGGDVLIDLSLTVDERFLLVSRPNSGTLTIINTSTNTVEDNIDINRPFGHAHSPDGKYIYIVNNGADTVSIMDASDFSVIDTISVGERPSSLALLPNGSFLYVTTRSDRVDVIDTRAREVVTSLDIEFVPNYLSFALGVGGKTLYVLNRTNGQADEELVFIVDTGTNTVTGAMFEPYDKANTLALSRDEHYLFINSEDGAEMLVMDTGTGTAVSRVNTTDTRNINSVILPNGNKLYVNQHDTADRVAVFDSLSLTNDTTPTLWWNVPGDADGDDLHFKVQLAVDEDFTQEVQSFESKNDSTGFSFTDAVPQGEGNANYSLQSPLDQGRYFWRVAAWDGLEYGNWSIPWQLDIGEMPELIIAPSQESYFPEDQVTINTTYSHGMANVSVVVRFPNGTQLFSETRETNEAGFTSFSFTLPADAPAGDYTVEANTTELWEMSYFAVEALQRPVALIKSITPNPALEGEDIVFSGEGVDDGTIQRYVWTSGIEGEIYNGSENTTVISFLSAGHTHIIGLRVRDDEGFWSETVTTTLTVTEKPVAVIDLISPSPAKAGETVTFFFNGTDDGYIQLYTWNSNIDGTLFNANYTSFSLDSLSAGTHTLGLRVQDDLGFWSDEVTTELQVIRGDTLSIVLGSPLYFPGEEVSITATYTGDQTDIGFEVRYPNGTLLARDDVSSTPAEEIAVATVWDSPTAMNFGLVEFKGEMYAGGMWSGDIYGSSDQGDSWGKVHDTGERNVDDSAVFDGMLYFGCADDEARIFRTANGANWDEVYHSGSMGGVKSMATFKGKLYAGTAGPSSVLSTGNGLDWSEELDEGHDGVSTMLVTKDYLYIAAGEGQGKTYFYRTSGNGSWEFISTFDVWSSGTDGMTEFHGSYYFASFDGDIYRTDDFIDFEQVFDIPQSWCIASYHDALFLGGSLNNADQDGDAVVYMSTDGETFELVYDSPEMKSCSFGYYSVEDALYFSGGTHWGSPKGTIYKLTGYPEELQKAVFSFDIPGDAPLGNYTVNVSAPMALAEDGFAVVMPGKPVALIDSITPSFANPGTEVVFSGHGVGDTPIEEYQWTSSIDGVIDTESSFQRDDLSLGLHTITLEVRDEFGLWSVEDTAELHIVEPSLSFTDLDVPDTAGTGDHLNVNVTVLSTFDTPQDVILALQLENSEHEPLDPVIANILVGPNESRERFLTIWIGEDEPTGVYQLQLQVYLTLPRDQGFALDFRDFELEATSGRTHRSTQAPSAPRTLVKGDATFSLETDVEELRPGEELTVSADLSAGDFPKGTPVSFEILDPEMRLKYTRSFVTGGNRKTDFTIKTRENYNPGEYIIYATAPLGDEVATAETRFTILEPMNRMKVGELLFEQGELTAYRKEGTIALDMGDDIQNFDILQTGAISSSLLVISSDFNPGLVPWDGDLYIFMGPETTLGLFIFDGHFQLWLAEGFVFIYTALDDPDDDWSGYFGNGTRAGPGEPPLQITNQPMDLIDDNFPGQDYELSIDIHELKGDVFFELNATENYNIVSMFRGHASLADGSETQQLAQGGKVSLSDGGTYQSTVRAIITENQGQVDMTIDAATMDENAPHYHIPLNQTATVDITTEVPSYHLQADCLNYLITGTGEGVSPYTTSTTILENNITRSWSWSSTVAKDEEDGYHITTPSEMTMTPGSTKNYTLKIREEKDMESRSFVIRDMPGYQEKDSTYTVNDWDNLDSTEEQSVDYTYEGTRVGMSSDEEATDVIERWLDTHEQDQDDEESWLAEELYGLPLYLYLFAVVLVAAVLVAYRRGRQEGTQAGRFYSRIKEQEKMKEMDSQTLESLTRPRSTDTQPTSLTGTGSPEKKSFAPPSLGTQATNGIGPRLPPGKWSCVNCGFTVESKFKFCTKCGTRRNT